MIFAIGGPARLWIAWLQHCAGPSADRAKLDRKVASNAAASKASKKTAVTASRLMELRIDLSPKSARYLTSPGVRSVDRDYPTSVAPLRDGEGSRRARGVQKALTQPAYSGYTATPWPMM